MGEIQEEALSLTVEAKTDPAHAAPVHSIARAQGADAAIHWVFLTMAAAVLAIAFILQAPGGELVVVPLVDFPLPGVCTFKRLLGIGCPGCGLTRCFISVAHGDLASAWAYNPAGILLFASTVFQLPFRWLQLRRIRRGEAPVRWPLLNWCLWGMLLLLLVQWVGRTVLGEWA